MTFQPVIVNIGEGAEGRLVFQDDQLVAVLVQLSALHGEQAGGWFLEPGFGPLAGPNPPVFADIDAASEWLAARLTAHAAISPPIERL
ncbi:MAG TPA: hypothetical protein VD906_01010 [Caulobacteraceae bacterium]|nr:hypothetical protein [Caulobacteraceae bacterium]